MGQSHGGRRGVEYYFGYRLPEIDLVAEDFRSRDRSWDFARIALQFFARERIPFWKMSNADELKRTKRSDLPACCGYLFSSCVRLRVSGQTDTAAQIERWGVYEASVQSSSAGNPYMEVACFDGGVQ